MKMHGCSSRGVVGLVVLVLLGGSARAAEEPKPNVALTIYSTATPGAIPPELYRPQPERSGYAAQRDTTVPGYAVVRQEREISLDGSRSTVRFTDVAALIDPTTVTFASLTDPQGTRVLEQSYQFDLVSTAKLMERYLDRKVTVAQARGQEVAIFNGTLLSTSGGLVLADDSGAVQILNGYSSVTFPELPGGLITRPTLVWDVATTKPGKQQARVSYQTGGITWWADYNLVFAEGKDANSGSLDVGAWVSIINASGAGYPDARLKLVAGDVQRVQPPQEVGFLARTREMKAEAAGMGGFEEKPFFEYHLYTLDRTTTLPDKSTKQIELFPAAHGVPCKKVLVYYGLAPGYRGFFPKPMTDRNYGVESNKKVDIYLRFKNEKQAGMGMPLPSGRVRVSKLDPADQSLEFIGEDTIDHTPKDEEVLIKLGSAFDVVGERKQIDFKIDTVRNWMEEEIEIVLRNHKEEPVDVMVKENLYRWVNWEIISKTDDFKKVDARTINFHVALKPDGEKTLRYRVRYTW
jgi:hypothetical protein